MEFKKIFNWSSSKDDAPAAPEKRIVPHFAKDLPAGDPRWITSQVFADGEKRVYYAAVPESSHRDGRIELVDIMEYSYFAQEEGSLLHEHIRIAVGIDRAIRKLVDLEKSAQADPKLSSVPGLEGNYRDVASLYGLHFDDDGTLISFCNVAPIVTSALFSRKQLDALYRQPKAEPAAPAIVTWDDYYREIVKGSDEKFADLTRALREGAEVYNQLITSLVISSEKLRQLESIGRRIYNVAQHSLLFSSETAKQIANVILQGPDSYCEKPSQKKNPGVPHP